MPLSSGTLQTIGTALNAGLPILGGAFGNRSQTSTSNYTTTPIFTPQQNALYGPLSSSYLNLLNNSTNLSGYQAGQSNIIAQNAARQKQMAIENLASKGITTGAAPGAALNAIDSQAMMQQNQLAQQIPLLQNQLTQEALGLGTNLFRTLPSGSNTAGSVTRPGNVLGGIFGNINPSAIMNLLSTIFNGINNGGFNPNSTNTGDPGTPIGLPFPFPTGSWPGSGDGSGDPFNLGGGWNDPFAGLNFPLMG